MGDYRNWPIRLTDAGLNIRDNPDRLQEGQYTRLQNVEAVQEGGFTSRKGITQVFIATGSQPIHTIRRLDTNTLFVAGQAKIYHNNIQYPVGDINTTGLPLSLVRFKSALSSNTWGYIGSIGVKVLGDGTIFDWGITAPTTGAIATITGAGNLDSTVTAGIAYDWRYTYYSSTTGAESNGSPVQPGIALAAQAVTVSVLASADPQVNTIRLYRRGGAIPSSWRFVTSINNITTTIDDNFADSTIANAFPLLIDNNVPFTTTTASGLAQEGTALPFIWGPFNGKYILGTGDSNNPGYVYWTNPGRPDSANVINNISVTAPTEPLMNGFIYGSIPYVWSRNNLYALDFGGPNALPTFRPRLMPVGMGLSSRWAFTADGPMIFFLSQDGIYATDGVKATSLTEDSMRPIFKGQNAGGFFAIDRTQEAVIRMAFQGQELHFWYVDTNGKEQHLFYNILYKRWKQYVDNILNLRGNIGQMGYFDENQNTQKLYIGNVNSVNITNTGTIDGTHPIICQVRTHSLDMQIPGTFKEYGNAIIDIDPNGNSVVVTPYFDNETVIGTSTTITGIGRQKVSVPLGDTFAHSVALDFAWTSSIAGPTIYQAEFLWRDDEEAIKHWEAPPTSHGLLGWQHVRDAYFCLTSANDVTLTLNVDGVLNGTYTLPATGSVRKKIYVKFNATKGKLFQYILDSPGDFRFYGEDTEIRAKVWNSVMGYQNIKPFQPLGYAPFLRKGSGT